MKKWTYFLLLFLSLFMVTSCAKKEDSKEKVESRELKENEKDTLMNLVDELKYMDYFGESFAVDSLSNQQVLRTSYEILKIKNDTNEDEVSFASLKEIAKDYFDYDLKEEDLRCDINIHSENDKDGINILLYNEKTGKYVENDSHLGHGGGGLHSLIYNYYVDGNVKENQYTIVVYKLFSDILGDIYEEEVYYYASYENASSSKDKLFKKGFYDELDNEYESYKDKLIKYTYTFNYVDDHYVLEEYKIGD